MENTFDPEKVERGYDTDAYGWTPDIEGGFVNAEDYLALLKLYRQTKFALELAEGDEGYPEGKWMKESENYGVDFSKPVPK